MPDSLPLKAASRAQPREAPASQEGVCEKAGANCGGRVEPMAVAAAPGDLADAAPDGGPGRPPRDVVRLCEQYQTGLPHYWDAQRSRTLEASHRRWPILRSLRLAPDGDRS
jgi:hypothetical protein